MKYLKLVSLALIPAVLASCGGGGGGGLGFDTGVGGSGSTPPARYDNGVGASGGVFGAVQGFGSVIVSDREMQTDDAVVIIEGTQTTSGDVSALKEGQQIGIIGDIQNLDAEEVRYRSNIKGPVTSLSNVDPLTGVGTFIVFGQTVRSNARTRAVHMGRL